MAQAAWPLTGTRVGRQFGALPVSWDRGLKGKTSRHQEETERNDDELGALIGNLAGGLAGWRASRQGGSWTWHNHGPES